MATTLFNIFLLDINFEKFTIKSIKNMQSYN